MTGFLRFLKRFGVRSKPGVTLLTDKGQLEELWKHDIAVIYKHSPICTLSAGSVYQVNRYLETDPDVPVYIVDVLGAREVSNAISDHLGLQHESPQVIVVRRGQAVWDKSHFGITKVAISAQVNAARA